MSGGTQGDNNSNQQSKLQPAGQHFDGYIGGLPAGQHSAGAIGGLPPGHPLQKARQHSDGAIGGLPQNHGAIGGVPPGHPSRKAEQDKSTNRDPVEAAFADYDASQAKILDNKLDYLLDRQQPNTAEEKNKTAEQHKATQESSKNPFKRLLNAIKPAAKVLNEQKVVVDKSSKTNNALPRKPDKSQETGQTR